MVLVVIKVIPFSWNKC